MSVKMYLRYSLSRYVQTLISFVESLIYGMRVYSGSGNVFFNIAAESRNIKNVLAE